MLIFFEYSHTETLEKKLLPYTIIPPVIKSGTVYSFITDSDVNYEVRFGRKQNNILNATIVFGVTNEEYDGEKFYLCPSVAVHGQKYGASADVWALGIILYEMVSLNDKQDLKPYMSESFGKIGPVYSNNIRNLLSAMLEEDAHKRLAINQLL